MMEEALFLFLYHQFDDVTQRHYQRLCQFHPHWQVVPLTYQFLGTTRLAGTVDVALEEDHGLPISEAWAERDKVFLRWFLGPKRPQARRYIFCEYDLYVNGPAEAFYGPTWQADVAAARCVVPQDAPQWPWWQQASWLEEAFPLRLGLSPLAGSLWSHAALTCLACQRRFLRCFAELRMGTLARVVGLEPQEIPGAKATLGWRPEQDPATAKATWLHPVKH
jgi:hypothetical protein